MFALQLLKEFMQTGQVDAKVIRERLFTKSKEGPTEISE